MVVLISGVDTVEVHRVEAGISPFLSCVTVQVVEVWRLGNCCRFWRKQSASLDLACG